jgi:RimJ/RimL family protein N-acetyltransferase
MFLRQIATLLSRLGNMCPVLSAMERPFRWGMILAILPREEKEIVIGVGQYALIEKAHTAEVGFAVRDEYQNKGTGTELLSTLTYLAKRRGLLGFYAEVLVENRAMFHLFEKMGFDIKKRREEGVYEMEMTFK